MTKVNLDEIKLEGTFAEMSEECQLAIEGGGCGGFSGGSIFSGGSVTSGCHVLTRGGWVKFE